MITGILLAAGSSRRFGCNKLTSITQQHTTLAMLSLRKLVHVVANSIVVMRPHDTLLQADLVKEKTRFIVCPESENGIGASIACGVRATSDASAWIIALADMPFIKTSTFESIVETLQGGAPICAPYYEGKRGHPVGFDKSLYSELIELKQDCGAKSIINNYKNSICAVNVADQGILIDIDTDQDAQKWDFQIN